MTSPVEQISELQLRKLLDGREYRGMTVTALPQEGDSFTVEGYAATFNQPYLLFELDGKRLMEQVDPHAFDACDMSDVIFQYNHEGRVYARNRNGTLRLAADGHGLLVTAQLGGTEGGRQLYREIQGGYIDRMSFGFIVGADEKTYSRDQQTGADICLRTIRQVTKLYDVSAVSIPANDMTSISARRLGDGAFSLLQAERLHARKRKRLNILLEV